MVVEQIVLARAAGSVTLGKTSAGPVDLEGWFLCTIPNYWPFPAGFELGPGETVRIDLSGGGSAPLSAGGALGRYGDSEAALSRDGNFGNSDGIVGYVGWRGGKGRKGVAQAAGIWDESLCEPGRGRAPAASDPMSGR